MIMIKEWITKTFKSVLEGLKNFAGPKLEKASKPVKVIGWLALGVVGLVGLIAAIGFMIAITVLIPGLIAGALLWFVWTFMGFGAAYFPHLDPMYLTIPYWHFVAFASVLTFFIRMIRPKKDKPANVTNNIMK